MRVGKHIQRVKVGDMKDVSVVRATKPSASEVPEIAPFKVRYAMAMLKGWGVDNEALKDTVKRRILNEEARCSESGRGVQAGWLTSMAKGYFWPPGPH